MRLTKIYFRKSNRLILMLFLRWGLRLVSGSSLERMLMKSPLLNLHAEQARAVTPDSSSDFSTFY